MFTYRDLYNAYKDCRRRKRNRPTSLAFEVDAEQHLLDLKEELNRRTYRPRPSFCFVARNDKYREVFAAQFKDRVVHHLLVSELEKTWEPVFIHDSYACRKGKGTHAAVERLQSFTRRVSANQVRRAWFAQLDVRAFFPSVDREILLGGVLSRIERENLRWLARIIIQHDPAATPLFKCSPEKWRNVPPHKSLFTVPPGKGLPIGNLTSQFFANVYLNALDQFVKHRLKARLYLRYVDDLVMLHKSREKLCRWCEEIDSFLGTELKLELNAERTKVRPVTNGINFLGYIVRPSHMYIRRRVAGKCRGLVSRAKVKSIKMRGDRISVMMPSKSYRRLHAGLNSYLGAYSHASCHNLSRSLFKEAVWLDFLFAKNGYKAIRKLELSQRPGNLFAQYRYFRALFSGVIFFQVGCFMELFDKDAVWAAGKLALKRIKPRRGFYARCGIPVKKVIALAGEITDRNTLYIVQTGFLHGRLMERVGCRIDCNVL